MKKNEKSARKEKTEELTLTEIPRAAGKYRIDSRVLSDGENQIELFLFSLYANNGQLLYESYPFASRKTCAGGIETFRNSLMNAKTIFMVDQDKNGQFRYIIKCGGNIYQGESYATKKSAVNSIDSVKRFGVSSPLSD